MRKRRSKIASIMQECHPKMLYPTTIEEVRKWLKIINKEIFEGQLKPFKKITIKRLHKMWAWCIPERHDNDVPYCNLELNHYMKSKRHLVEILAHESVHRAQWQFEEKSDHGRSFFAYKSKLAKFGIKLTL